MAAMADGVLGCVWQLRVRQLSIRHSGIKSVLTDSDVLLVSLLAVSAGCALVHSVLKCDVAAMTDGVLGCVW